MQGTSKAAFPFSSVVHSGGNGKERPPRPQVPRCGDESREHRARRSTTKAGSRETLVCRGLLEEP